MIKEVFVITRVKSCNYTNKIRISNSLYLSLIDNSDIEKTNSRVLTFENKTSGI